MVGTVTLDIYYPDKGSKSIVFSLLDHSTNLHCPSEVSTK